MLFIIFWILKKIINFAKKSLLYNSVILIIFIQLNIFWLTFHILMTLFHRLSIFLLRLFRRLDSNMVKNIKILRLRGSQRVPHVFLYFFRLMMFLRYKVHLQLRLNENLKHGHNIVWREILLCQILNNKNIFLVFDQAF